MSHDVLINDLRAKGEQRVEALWREARAEAERTRSEAAARLAGELGRCDLAGRAGGQAVHRRRAMAARREAGAIIARAEQEFSERLAGLARELLGEGWSGDRGALLAGLAAELPAGEWVRVRVHPEDVAEAGRLLPGAAIVADAQVKGGLEVTSADGTVTIDNTLNARLARIWSQLMPELLREVRQDAPAG